MIDIRLKIDLLLRITPGSVTILEFFIVDCGENSCHHV